MVNPIANPRSVSTKARVASDGRSNVALFSRAAYRPPGRSPLAVWPAPRARKRAQPNRRRAVAIMDDHRRRAHARLRPAVEIRGARASAIFQPFGAIAPGTGYRSRHCNPSTE